MFMLFKSFGTVLTDRLQSDSLSAAQEITLTSFSPKMYYLAHKSPPLTSPHSRLSHLTPASLYNFNISKPPHLKLHSSGSPIKFL
jgi:hypothetical protein